MVKYARILALLLLFVPFAPVSASALSGVHYLESQQASDGTIGDLAITGWAAMAFSMEGTPNSSLARSLEKMQSLLPRRPATDIERQILALEALGEDSRTFAGINAVNLLENKISGDQIGDPTLLNDDIFGILALKAAGRSVSGTLVTGLVKHQGSDGGWGINPGGASSTDMTALALIALKGTGTDQGVMNQGLDYLRVRQNSDGGFATMSGGSSLGSTAWVDWMITSLGYRESDWQKGGKTAAEYIASQQSSNGSWQNSPLLTSYSIMALSRRSFPFVRSTPLTPQATPLPALVPLTIPVSPRTTSSSATSASPVSIPTLPKKAAIRYVCIKKRGKKCVKYVVVKPKPKAVVKKVVKKIVKKPVKKLIKKPLLKKKATKP